MPLGKLPVLTMDFHCGDVHPPSLVSIGAARGGNVWRGTEERGERGAGRGGLRESPASEGQEGREARTAEFQGRRRLLRNQGVLCGQWR